MKVKISHLILLSIASSVLFGGYLLTSKPELTLVEKPQATQPIAQTTPKKAPTLAIKQKMDSAYSEPTVTVEQSIIDEASLQANLNKTLIAINTDESVRLSDLNSIAQCYRCLQILQNYLLTNNLTEQQLTQLIDSLVITNRPELAAMLLETVEKIAQQSSDNPHEAIIINALARFDSAQVAKDFSNYLVRDREISKPLQDALRNSINESAENRTQVATNIVKQFNETNDIAVREKLLTINHPEALAQIGSEALAQNDVELYKQIIEQLKNNPSKYTLDALLSMEQISSTNADQVNQVINASYQLAERQLGGDRLDYIEAKLVQGAYSEQEKLRILDVLSHSEDQLRGSEIIARYSN